MVRTAARDRFVGAVLVPIIAVTVGLAHLTNVAAEDRARPAALRDGTPKIRIADRLAVNRDAGTRLLVPNKCEKEGERDLRALASTSRVEESYVFIPALCLWIEVGFDEKSTSVRLDDRFVVAVSKHHPSLVIYHIQPSLSLGISNHFPSYKDMITLVLFNASAISKSAPEIKHRIVTTLGTMEYEFSDKVQVGQLMRKYRRLGLHGHEAQNLAFEYMRVRYREDYIAQVRKCASNHGTLREKIIRCSPIRTTAFALNFRPFD